jgi:hypothetical protein
MSGLNLRNWRDQDLNPPKYIIVKVFNQYLIHPVYPDILNLSLYLHNVYPDIAEPMASESETESILSHVTVLQRFFVIAHETCVTRHAHMVMLGICFGYCLEPSICHATFLQLGPSLLSEGKKKKKIDRSTS